MRISTWELDWIVDDEQEIHWSKRAVCEVHHVRERNVGWIITQ